MKSFSLYEWNTKKLYKYTSVPEFTTILRIVISSFTVVFCFGSLDFGSDLLTGIDLNTSNLGFFLGASPAKSACNERGWGGVVYKSVDFELRVDIFI
jgi:hypothetical protein